MRENINANRENDRKLSGGYKLNDNSFDDNETDIRELEELFYEVPDLSEKKEKEIDEMIREVERKAFLEKIQALAEENEKKCQKKVINIGHFGISKVACILVIICLSVVTLGVTAYASIRIYIQSIQVKDMRDHSELEIEYNDVSDVDAAQKNYGLITDFCYYEPIWVPDGYHMESEYKSDVDYSIVYDTENSESYINYQQYLPFVKHHYSTENGKSESVSFGKYSGEYIETDDANYLIVTDGTYIYSLISESVYKDEFVKMIYNTKIVDK